MTIINEDGSIPKRTDYTHVAYQEVIDSQLIRFLDKTGAELVMPEVYESEMLKPNAKPSWAEEGKVYNAIAYIDTTPVKAPEPWKDALLSELE